MVTRVLGMSALATIVATVATCIPSRASVLPRVVVAVVDAATHAPLAGAMVTLTLYDRGGFARRAATDDGGSATFPDAPYGNLVVTVTKEGYAPARSLAVLRVGMSEADVNVVLASLKIIVHASSHASVRYQTFDSDGAFAPLFLDLADQMNSLGGADVRLSPSGTLAGISLEGADPSLTSTSFDGTEVQSASSLDTIDVDQITRATVDLSAQSVKLFGLTPSPYAEVRGAGSFGGFGRDEVQGTETGTAGATGFAGQFGIRSQRSPLDGQTYKDTSGFTYDHTGRFLGGFGAIALSIPVSDSTSLTIKELRHVSRSSPLQVVEAGSLLAGYGPYPVFGVDDGSVTELGLHGSSGPWQLLANYTDFASNGSSDFNAAYAGGVPAPSGETYRSNEGDLTFTAIHTSASDRTLNINASLSTSSDYDVTTFGAAADVSATHANRELLSVDYNGFAHGDRLFYEATGDLGRDATNSLLAGKTGIFLRLRGRAGTLFGSASTGSQLALIPTPSAFGTPSTTQYDCQSGTAVASAPNDLPSVPHGTELRAGATRAFGGVTISAQAYDRSYGGVTLSSALVPAALEPFGFVPPGVTAAILAGADAFGGCAPSVVPALYFEHDVSGVRVDYRGAEVTLGGRLRGGVQYQLAIDDHRALLSSSDPRLEGALSTYVPGAQLPGIPPLAASTSLAFPLGRSARALLNDTFVTSNNEFHLPAYDLVTAGLVMLLGRHTYATLVASNVADRYSGAIVSPRYAVGIPTVGGIPYLPLATPLQIPQLYLGVRWRVTSEPKL